MWKNRKTRENTYLMTMVSRKPRQIVGFDVAFDKSPKRIQSIVEGVPPASKYCAEILTLYIQGSTLGTRTTRATRLQ